MKPALRLLLVLATLAWTASQASAVPGRAEVMKVVGTATVSKATGGSASITQGMVLGTGDTVTTGPASTVDLNLGLNGDFLRVDPDSSLKIDNLDIANIADRTVTTQLNVNRGAITGNVVNKLTKASKYEIKSASGVAGIRGTVYSVKTDASGRITSIICTSGTVNFTQGGVTVTITAGQALTPPADGTALTQATVRAATEGEKTQTATAANSIGTGAGQTDLGGGVTVINNPADVSTSVSQLPAALKQK
jgi:hypothetical protein